MALNPNPTTAAARNSSNTPFMVCIGPADTVYLFGMHQIFAWIFLFTQIAVAGPVEGVTGLGPSGADRVLHATHEGFGLYNPDGYAATIASIGGSYAAVVFAASATGRDLAPRVAAKLRTACATDVTALHVEGGKIVATRQCMPAKPSRNSC